MPTGLNFLIGGYTYSEGGLATDPATPLKNANLQIHAPFVAYARSFDAWRKSGKLDLVLATACLSGEAEANGVPVSRDVCGLLDPALRVTVNVFGAPALTLEEFRHYRQDLIVGVGLQVMAPFGQYDPDRLVNLGTNRWAFKPEIGLSKKLGALSVEAALGATFFTTNDDYFGGRTREQDPIVSTQLHLIYEFRGGRWLAINGTYYGGGRTTLDGEKQNDELSSTRLGATLALPVDRHHSVKLHASTGVSVRYGDDFTTVGAAWQYRWGGGF